MRGAGRWARYGGAGARAVRDGHDAADARRAAPAADRDARDVRRHVDEPDPAVRDRVLVAVLVDRHRRHPDQPRSRCRRSRDGRAKITRDDLEAGIRQLQGGASDKVVDKKKAIATAAGIGPRCCCCSPVHARQAGRQQAHRARRDQAGCDHGVGRFRGGSAQPAQPVHPVQRHVQPAAAAQPVQRAAAQRAVSRASSAATRPGWSSARSCGARSCCAGRSGKPEHVAFDHLAIGHVLRIEVLPQDTKLERKAYRRTK